MAGVVGIHPGELTLRQLTMMAEGKMARDWDHTAAIISTLININRDPKQGKPVTSNECHPFLSRKMKKPKPIQGSIQDLKVLLK